MIDDSPATNSMAAAAPRAIHRGSAILISLIISGSSCSLKIRFSVKSVITRIRPIFNAYFNIFLIKSTPARYRFVSNLNYNIIALFCQYKSYYMPKNQHKIIYAYQYVSFVSQQMNCINISTNNIMY